MIQTASTAKINPTMRSVICKACDYEIPIDEAADFGGFVFLCSGCYDTATFICIKCGKRFLNEDNAGDYDIMLCESCYNREYTRCDDCGLVVRVGNIFYAKNDVGTKLPCCKNCSGNIKIRRRGVKRRPLKLKNKLIKRKRGAII